MELMTYKTRAVRTLSLLILVALIAALNPPSLTDSTAFAQDAVTVPELSSTANTANQVDLSWTAVPDADEYELWRWENTEGWVELDDSISGTTYADTGVTAGLTYYYQVSADGGNNWSNRVNETVGAYDASVFAAPTATSTTVSLSWSAVTGATSYELWRYENSWTQIGGALTGTTHDDTNVEIGKTYYYQVMAKGPNGDGAWSNRVSANVPTTTPGMPLNFSATPGDAQVTLSWDAPASNGGSAITGYQYRYQMAGGAWSSWMATSPALARTATVTSLTNESNYNFEVQAVNARGPGDTATDSAMPMSTVPDTPMSFGSTSTGPTEIALSWDAVTGAVSYQLQRRTNGGAWGAPMDAGSGTTYTDMGLTPSTTYDYEVRSVNAAGSSPWSAVVTASTTGPEVPDAVSDLSATASADKITLMWTMPDNNGAAITGYDLDVSDDGSDWDDLATKAAGDTSHEHMDLDPGTMKYYRIRAMNSEGDSDWSTSAMATVAAVAPGKPTLYATASGTTVMLSWVAPAATGGADITRYMIQVSSNGTTGWGSLATKAGTDTTHNHTGLAAGTTRYYRINATNSAGTGDWSDVASATVGGAEPPPGAATDGTSPQNVRVTQQPLPTGATSGETEASILIEWDASTPPTGRTLKDDGDGSTFNDGYKVEVWNGSTQAWDPVTDDAASPADEQLTDSGLMGTTKYTYRVVAVFDDDSMGKYSEQKFATTVAVSPAMPVLTATAMGRDKIMVSWTVADDGGSDIVRYELQGSDDGTAWSNFADPAEADPEVTELEAVQKTYTEMGLGAAATRHYRVRAVNSVVTSTGTDDNAAKSAWSDSKSATTGTGAPAAPVVADGAVASTGDATAPALTFTWAAPDDTGGSPITFYHVQQLDGGEWKSVQENDETDLTYVEDGLAGMVTRYYRVRARNANGYGPFAEASGTTGAGVPSAPKLTATVNGESSITLSWTKPANGGEDITGYTIQVLNADGTDYVDATDTDLTDLTDPDDLTVIDSELDGGTKLSYRVVAVNANGSSQPSNVATATTDTGGKPGKPVLAVTNTADGTASSTTLYLSWDPPSDAPADTPFAEGTHTINDGGSSITGYDIAVYEDGDWVSLVNNVSPDPRSYNHMGLTGMTTGYYSIRARNANGAGSWSDVVSATTAASAPGMPVLTAAPDGATKIVLNWTAPDDGGTAITAYHVQVSNNGSTGWNNPDDDDNDPGTGDVFATVEAGTDDPAPAQTYTHMDLNGMQLRFYRVRAVNGTNAADQGDWSVMKSARTPAGKPGMPTLTATADGSDTIDLTWNMAANSDGGSRITGYEIEVWDSAKSMWMDLMTATSMSYTHTGLPGSSTRHYRVRAMNAVGYSGWSNVDNAITEAGKPGMPMLTAAANGTMEIRLTWTEPATGGDDSVSIASYQLQVSNDGTTGWTSPEESTTFDDDGNRVHVISTAGTMNYTHTGIDPATMKYYRIRAVNSSSPPETGPWSNVASAMTDGGRPGQPKLTATASGTSMINLGWTPPEGDGGSAITGYELQYWDGSNGWMDLAAPAAGVTSHTHRNIGGGTTKYYRIRAMNSAGAGVWSTISHATTATAAPAPPTLMAMADGATMLKLTWTAGHDGGLAITKYHLQHSSDAGRNWADINNNIMSMRMLSHTDMGLTGGVTKHYRIRAWNSKGWSGWSPLASATTEVSVPGKPTLIASPLPNAVELNWGSPATPNGGLAIIRYEIQKWDSAIREWSDEGRTTSTRYRDSGLMNGKRYYYRVRAVNREGAGMWSTFRHATPAVPTEN